jgi:hypothetical protein
MLSAGFIFSDAEICQLQVQALIGQLAANSALSETNSRLKEASTLIIH